MKEVKHKKTKARDIQHSNLKKGKTGVDTKADRAVYEMPVDPLEKKYRSKYRKDLCGILAGRVIEYNGAAQSFNGGLTYFYRGKKRVSKNGESKKLFKEGYFFCGPFDSKSPNSGRKKVYNRGDRIIFVLPLSYEIDDVSKITGLDPEQIYRRA